MTKKPSYRFVDYTEPWVEKKLGDVSTITMGQSPNSENYTDNPNDYILVQGNADMKNGRVFPRVWTTQITKQARQGDLILSVRAPVGDIGKTDYDVVLGRGVASIDGNEFLYQALSQMKQNGYWSKLSTGSTFESINSNDIKSAIISLPSLPEQTAIGSFFQDIDQLISIQQRKLEVLKEQKKTYLKLLFPAKGQTKPALRFAGFEDDWKEVKLGEVGETYTGLSGKTKEDFGHGEGKFITYVNVFNNPLTDLYGLDSVEIDDKQRRVQYGDVLFTTSSETPEDVGLSSVWMGTEDNVYLNSFCFGYRPQKGIFNLYYLSFVLRSFSVRKEFMLLAQGISRFNISKTKVMDMSIHVPSLPEQEAIGSFFQDLDKAIAKQEEKVNQLKESKQTLLRKMFI